MCPKRLSCFQKVIGGRRCYCLGGPGDPGMTTVHLGLPAQEVAGREKQMLAQMTNGPTALSGFFKSRDSRLTTARACQTPPACPSCWRC